MLVVFLRYNKGMTSAPATTSPTPKGLSRKQLTQVGLLIAGTVALLGGVASAGITGAILSAAEGNTLASVLLIIGTAFMSLLLLVLIAYFIGGSIFFHRTLKGTTFLSRRMEEKKLS